MYTKKYVLWNLVKGNSVAKSVVFCVILAVVRTSYAFRYFTFNRYGNILYIFWHKNVGIDLKSKPNILTDLFKRDIVTMPLSGHYKWHISIFILIHSSGLCIGNKHIYFKTSWHDTVNVLLIYMYVRWWYDTKSLTGGVVLEFHLMKA